MVLNLDPQIQRQENAVRKKQAKGEPIPPAVIGHYNDLLAANLGGEITNTDTDAAVAQNLEHIFIASSDAVTTGVVATGAVALAAGLFTNLNSTTNRYLLIYDKATDPVGGDTPMLSIILPAGGAYELKYDFLPGGIPFTNGIAWAFSTDPDMYSSASAANKVLTFFYA